MTDQREDDSERKRRLLATMTVLALLGAVFVPATPVLAADPVVSIDTPSPVAEGKSFTVQVDVDSITDFDAGNYDITYDPAVLQVDDATTSDINDRQWKRYWPHYVRVNQAEFINGQLGDCVSLYDLMRDLGSSVVLPTVR